MKLLISQKDQIFKLIENNDYFSPHQFEIVEMDKKIEKEIETLVVFKESEYFFGFVDSSYNASFYLNYHPGNEQFLEVTSPLMWKEGMAHFNKWLNNLKREINAPNLWQKFQTEATALNMNFDSDNSKFTINEYNELKQKIDFIINQLPNIQLGNQQQIEIASTLQHLLTLSNELGKFDWKSLFIGTIISIIIQLNVTKENADLLWQLIKSSFNTFLLK